MSHVQDKFGGMGISPTQQCQCIIWSSLYLSHFWFNQYNQTPKPAVDFALSRFPTHTHHFDYVSIVVTARAGNRYKWRVRGPELKAETNGTESEAGEFMRNSPVFRPRWLRSLHLELVRTMFESFWCTCLKMASNSKTVGHRIKLTKICDLRYWYNVYEVHVPLTAVKLCSFKGIV